MKFKEHFTIYAAPFFKDLVFNKGNMVLKISQRRLEK